MVCSISFLEPDLYILVSEEFSAPALIDVQYLGIDSDVSSMDEGVMRIDEYERIYFPYTRNVNGAMLTRSHTV